MQRDTPMGWLVGRREQRIADAVIANPQQRTTMDSDGAARSVQAAKVELPRRALLTIWSPMYLERLARTYWWFLSRITLGLVRVRYDANGRSIVLLGWPLVMLRFDPPQYRIDSDRGTVSWRIRDGLLVARPNRGFLRIDVRRLPTPRPDYESLYVEVEVADFYPRLARPFRWFYINTQSRIHVLISHAFLRYLAHLNLRESPVGRFAAGGPADERSEQELSAERATIGDTPLRAAAAFTAVSAVVAALAVWAYRRR